MDAKRHLDQSRDDLALLQFRIKVLQDHLARGVGGREAALVQTKLDEARLWMRELWALLGAE